MTKPTSQVMGTVNQTNDTGPNNCFKQTFEAHVLFGAFSQKD